MLNEMGQDMESGIVGIIKWLTKLMQNWRETMRTLRELAVSFGTAKAAMWAYDLIIQKTTADTIANTTATNVASKAVKGFSATLGRVGIFAAVMGLTYLVQKLIDVATAASRAAKEVRDFENAASEGVSGTVAQYQQLAREWKHLGDSQSERATWIKEHKRLFDELGISINNANEADRYFSEEGTEAYINALKRRAVADAYKQKYAQLILNRDSAENEMERLRGEGKKYVSNRAEYVLAETEMALGISNRYVPGSDEAGGRLYYTKAYQNIINERHQIEQEIAEVDKKIKEWEEGAMATAPGSGYQPVTTGGTNEGESGKVKAKKLVDKYWEAQKALLEAQYEGYELERKLAEMNRDKQYAELNKWYTDQKAAIEENVKDEDEKQKKLKELDRQYFAIRKGIRNDFDKAIDKSIQKEIDDEKKADKEKIKQEEENFKKNQEIQKRQFELTKHTAREERKFVMQQQMEFLQWRIDNAKALGISPELLEVMKKEYAQMQEMFNKGIYSTGKKNTYSSGMEVIADVLGFDIDSNQISALNSVFDQAKEALNSWMDARKAAADQAKELADDEVSAAENALNREIELRNQGYANDVALREKELADAKAAQKKAVEEQKKIAKEQVLLDAALQTSSLLTASANIMKQFPNPALWIPMLATLWGTFAYAKVKSYQSAEKSITFGEGGSMLLEGGSHASGHDVNLGIGPDGSNLRAEGGEYFAVINKRSSRKYGSQIPAVVNALNSGMFEDRYIKTSDAVGLLPQVIRADNGSYVDLSKVEGGVSELVKQGEQNWTIEGGYRVLRYKNLTRRVKIG